MNNSFYELESIIIENLKSIIVLKNDNEKKEKEKRDHIKNTALGIIDILDSFERVEENIMEKGLDNNEEVKKIVTRYKTIKKKLQNFLSKNGVTLLEFPDNTLIVGVCEVVDKEPDIGRKNDEIISIVRNGYMRGQELIRAAQIIVVKN